MKQILYYNTLDYTLPTDQDLQEIDLSRFTNHLVNRFNTIRPELEWQLSLNAILVRANSERLLVAFENILDNQIRYANKFIRMVIRKDDKYAIIHISNDGPTIPPNQLPNLFKNLYRGTNGKFGLGLAITYKIITFYGGDLTVENNAIGVTFKIKFPLCPL